MDFFKAGQIIKCINSNIPNTSAKFEQGKLYEVGMFDKKGDNPDWNFVIDENNRVRIINNIAFKPYFEVVENV